MILDSNGPVPSLIGIFSKARGRKYFNVPIGHAWLISTDTELVLYGP